MNYELITHMLKTGDVLSGCELDLESAMGYLVSKGLAHSTPSFGNSEGFCLTERGRVLGKMTSKQIIRRIQKDNLSVRKTKFEHFISWYGILGTTVTIIGFWAFGWQVWGWWFFGLVA